MAWLSFHVWWQRPQNQQHFWRTNGNGVAISLGETPRYIFRQILQRLKEYHDQNVGYGNLLQGMLIGENKQVFLANDGSIPNSPLEPLASIRQDFLDFKKLVTLVETIISTEQRVQPSYSSEKFHDLFTLLDDERCNSTVDGLRRFGFYMRNNPLFLDEAAKFLFFRKVLTLKEFDDAAFRQNVMLWDIQGWFGNVRDNHLKAVRDYRRDRRFPYPTNYWTYMRPDGSIVFYRNCLGHIRSSAPFDDAEILHALEDDLPRVIPVWFNALVYLDLDPLTCSAMCGSGWMEFLSMQPSVFT